jgi:hypothetical protein
MFLAKFDSPNFSFQAYGNTRLDAETTLKQGLNLHGLDYDLDKDWWHKWKGDIQTIEINLGVPYRDNEALKSKNLVLTNSQICTLYDNAPNMTIRELSKITGLSVHDLKLILLHS